MTWATMATLFSVCGAKRDPKRYCFCRDSSASGGAVRSAVIAKLDSETLQGELLTEASGVCALRGRLPTEPCFVVMPLSSEESGASTWFQVV